MLLIVTAAALLLVPALSGGIRGRKDGVLPLLNDVDALVPLGAPLGPLKESGPHVGRIPTVKLSNGVEMPMVGLGTWQFNNTEAEDAALLALSVGYVHIDTATMYKNHFGVGQAIKRWGGDRNKLFVTTKIPGGGTEKEAEDYLYKALEELQLEYVDLMLVHFPAHWGGSGGPERRISTWKAMTEFYKKGNARAIGVSHYCKRHIEDLMKPGLEMPMVNQVEFHVGMGAAGPNATDNREFCESHGILYQSFSPLCGPCGTDELVKGELVNSTGKKYGKTGAQVSLRWQVQQGIPVIPKTNSLEHLLANADIFDWELSDEDMKVLSHATSPPVTGGGGDGTSGDCKIP